jgi:hypothetical protein
VAVVSLFCIFILSHQERVPCPLSHPPTEYIDLSPSLFSPHPEPNNPSGDDENDDHDNDKDYVHVWALSQVPNATQVHVEPCSRADWELIQQHAAWLEGVGGDGEENGNSSGGLLQQVSIVYPGQVLSLRVPPPITGTRHDDDNDDDDNLGRGRRHGCSSSRMVQLRVLSGGTMAVRNTHASDSTSHIWPVLDDDNEQDDDETHDDAPAADDHHRHQEHNKDDKDTFCCCFRLVQDTEVIVAPYEEQHKAASSLSDCVFSLYPTLQDYMDRDYDDNIDDINNDHVNMGTSSAAVVKALADRLRHVLILGKKNNSNHSSNHLGIATTTTTTTTSPSHIAGPRRRQRPPQPQQVSLLTSTTIPPFTAMVHPTILSRLLQQQQQQPQADMPSDHHSDKIDQGGELLVQLRAVPSRRNDNQDQETTASSSSSSSSSLLFTVVQLQASKAVPEDRIGMYQQHHLS